MSGYVVFAALAAAFLLLWWTTRRIARKAQRQQAGLMQAQNSELRHVVTEMAIEKHSSRNSDR